MLNDEFGFYFFLFFLYVAFLFGSCRKLRSNFLLLFVVVVRKRKAKDHIQGRGRRMSEMYHLLLSVKL